VSDASKPIDGAMACPFCNRQPDRGKLLPGDKTRTYVGCHEHTKFMRPDQWAALDAFAARARAEAFEEAERAVTACYSRQVSIPERPQSADKARHNSAVSQCAAAIRALAANETPAQTGPADKE